MHDRPLSRSLLVVAAVTTLLLLLPLIAMQFTSEVRWGPGDFLAAGCLLFVTGAGMALVSRYVKHKVHRVALIGLLALGLAIVWAELAVGIFT
jgi:VIT1/CCC1 family predicted Fe2+/Mn2+ transporter